MSSEVQAQRPGLGQTFLFPLVGSLGGCECVSWRRGLVSWAMRASSSSPLYHPSRDHPSRVEPYVLQVLTPKPPSMCGWRPKLIDAMVAAISISPESKLS